MFDPTLLIAEDDPHKDLFLNLPQDTASIRLVPAVGCERFAEMAYNELAKIIANSVTKGTALNPTVRVKSVEVFEHGANSSIYEG